MLFYLFIGFFFFKFICHFYLINLFIIFSLKDLMIKGHVVFLITFFFFCSFALGISLFANEHINRGVTSSVTGLSYVTTNFRLAYAQVTTTSFFFLVSLCFQCCSEVF